MPILSIFFLHGVVSSYLWYIFFFIHLLKWEYFSTFILFLWCPPLINSSFLFIYLPFLFWHHFISIILSLSPFLLLNPTIFLPLLTYLRGLVDSRKSTHLSSSCTYKLDTLLFSNKWAGTFMTKTPPLKPTTTIWTQILLPD